LFLNAGTVHPVCSILLKILGKTNKYKPKTIKMKKRFSILNFPIMIIVAILALNSCIAEPTNKKKITIDGYYSYERGDVKGYIIVSVGKWNSSLYETGGNQILVSGYGTESEGILYNEYNMQVGSANGTIAQIVLPDGSTTIFNKQ